jgi:O-antigen/teichoic acid export membrane protein
MICADGQQMSISRHTGYNIVGALVPVALSLSLIPVFVDLVGLARYGLLSICWALLGYFGLFDLGTGRAVAQRIAALKHETKEVRNSAFWTSAVVCALLCGIAALAVLAASPLIIEFLRLEDKALAAELRQALSILAFALPIGMLSSQVSGALEGSEEFGAVNAISITSTILVICLPIAAAGFVAPNLYYLVIASTTGRAIGLIAYAIAAVVLIPIRAPTFDRRNIAHLLSFGSWSTISNTVSPIMTMFDRFLIGRLLNPGAVGIYVLPFSLMSQLQILPAGLTRALFPKIASATELDAAQASGTAILFLDFVLTCALAGMVPLIAPFLCAWLGSETGLAAAPVAYALVIGIWSNSLALVIAVKLQAQGKPRFLALLHLAEVVPFLVFLYFGVRILGVTGAALAWSLRCLIDALIIFKLQKVHLDTSEVVKNGAALLAISAFSLVLPIGTALHWIIVVTLSLFTIMRAWRNRPASARTIEQRVRRVIAWNR